MSNLKFSKMFFVSNYRKLDLLGAMTNYGQIFIILAATILVYIGIIDVELKTD